jgi:glycosyltransferase involved in cell wall biosynthesis
MRAALDTRVLDRPATAERGIGRYVSSLLAALEEQGMPVVAARSLRERRAADVVHAPSIDGLSVPLGRPLVVTVHDLVPLRRPDVYLRTGLRHRIRYAAVKRAARVIAPSQAVADDCRRLLGVDAVVVREAAGAGFRPVADPRGALARLELPERFFCWVGGLDPPDPRKGIAALASAVAHGHGPPLVLAGRVGPEAADLAAPGRVMLAGRLSDDELAALYSAADALVFPSDDEGFGLPPLEALACGTPVAAFAIPALRETLEGVRGAALVEPGDIEGLLAAAEALSGSPVDAPLRTWTDVARETWAAYEAAIASQRPQLR